MVEGLRETQGIKLLIEDRPLRFWQSRSGLFDAGCSMPFLEHRIHHHFVLLQDRRSQNHLLFLGLFSFWCVVQLEGRKMHCLMYVCVFVWEIYVVTLPCIICGPHVRVFACECVSMRTHEAKSLFSLLPSTLFPRDGISCWFWSFQIQLDWLTKKLLTSACHLLPTWDPNHA